MLANAALLRAATWCGAIRAGWTAASSSACAGRSRWPWPSCSRGLAVLSPPLRAGAYNVLLVVAFFFALQGLAVVAFYAHRLAAPPLLRWAVLVLVLVNPWAPQILALSACSTSGSISGSGRSRPSRRAHRL